MNATLCKLIMFFEVRSIIFSSNTILVGHKLIETTVIYGLE